MHFAVKVVGQAAIVVQSRQIRAAHVAHLQLLVARRARGIGQRTQFALFVLARDFGNAHFVVLGHGGRDFARLAQNADFQQARVDCLCEVGDLRELVARV